MRRRQNVGKTEILLKILETEYGNHFKFIVIMCPTISDNNKTYLSRKWIFDDNNVFIVCDVKENLTRRPRGDYLGTAFSQK